MQPWPDTCTATLLMKLRACAPFPRLQASGKSEGDVAELLAKFTQMRAQVRAPTFPAVAC